MYKVVFIVITSKQELEYFLKKDRENLGKETYKPEFFSDEIWRFQITLRKLEYHLNTNKNHLKSLFVFYYKIKYKLYSRILGFSIPPNTFEAGLSIAHRGTVVVNSAAKIGENCRIHTDVVIGTEAGTQNTAPTLGDNVYIGPGSKIFGEIYLANGIAIGANSVVNKSFYEENITIGGLPAEKLSDKGVEKINNKKKKDTK